MSAAAVPVLKRVCRLLDGHGLRHSACTGATCQLSSLRACRWARLAAEPLGIHDAAGAAAALHVHRTRRAVAHATGVHAPAHAAVRMLSSMALHAQKH